MTFDKRRLLIAAAVLVAAAVAVFLWLRSRGNDEGAGSSKAAAKLAGPKRVGSGEQGGSQLPTAAPVAQDNDPVGDLRLEGQVLGPGDEPVAGALVALGSVPPRTATTEKDGSFEFDKLVGRTYALTARSGEMVGGPVMHTLRADSDPVVIRLAQGASVEVTVVAAGTGTPIAGATVDAGDGKESGAPTATTGADGVALLKGIRPGSFEVVSARASGHAPGQALVQVPNAPGAKGAARIELRRGAPVSGVVVDEGGGPVAGAHVAARDVSQPWDLPDERDQATTDDKGRFTLQAVAAGTYRFAATHSDHAPASSDQVTVDGSAKRDDVRIQMRAGGIAAGRVVDGGGAPVPWATVRIGSTRGAMQLQDVATRQVVAGAQGEFEVKGLARAPLSAIALSESAASLAVSFDLTTTRDKRDLVLKLELTGSISGVVVDGAGEAVAEAQVSGYPDFFAGEVSDDFALRGAVTDSTDGGGRFTLRGLPPKASYRLFAGRSGLGQNPFAREGTKAKTGDANLKLVLQADGAVKGKVAFEDGSAPALFTVSTGFVAGVPVASKDGSFELPSLAPGTHDIAIRGPDFAETFVRGVKVVSGQTEDVGSVVVKRGRNVTGRVLTSGGKPVAGATVVLGKQLFGDGKSLASSAMSGFEEQMGVRRTTSDGDGHYALRGIGDKELVIAAEHEAEGRSPASPVPAGTGSVAIDLKLAGVGSVSGRVRAGGKPAASAQVIATAREAAHQNIMVTTGDDGAYTIERLAAGNYKVAAMLGSGFGGTMSSRTVAVKAGQKATLDIDIALGDVTLAVAVQALSGTVNSAQIFLFDGAVSVDNAKQLNEKVLATSEGGGAQVKIWMGGDPVKFEKVAAGKKSVCVIPITGNLADPTFRQRLQENVDKLKVYCKPVEVKATPAEQTFTAAVPPMDPLPAPQ